MRLPMTLAPVRSYVARAMSLSMPSSPPSPSLRFSRNQRCGNNHACSSDHFVIQRLTPGSSCFSGEKASSAGTASGAMKPSSDIVTLKNTFPAISSPLPSLSGSSSAT